MVINESEYIKINGATYRVNQTFDLYDMAEKSEKFEFTSTLHYLTFHGIIEEISISHNFSW
jgi:hypothetical protein